MHARAGARTSRRRSRTVPRSTEWQDDRSWGAPRRREALRRIATPAQRYLGIAKRVRWCMVESRSQLEERRPGARARSIPWSWMASINASSCSNASRGLGRARRHDRSGSRSRRSTRSNRVDWEAEQRSRSTARSWSTRRRWASRDRLHAAFTRRPSRAGEETLRARASTRPAGPSRAAPRRRSVSVMLTTDRDRSTGSPDTGRPGRPKSDAVRRRWLRTLRLRGVRLHHGRRRRTSLP